MKLEEIIIKLKKKRDISKEDAMGLFKPVEKEILKHNRWYPYTAYEYQGETFYSIQYSGLAEENKI